MNYRAHKLTAALILLAAVFMLPPNESAVFGINPALGLMFIAPAIVLTVLIMRRTA